jgi:hypothetical protein
MSDFPKNESEIAPRVFQKKGQSGQREFHYGGHQNSPRTGRSRRERTSMVVAQLVPAGVGPALRNRSRQLASMLLTKAGPERREEHEKGSGGRDRVISVPSKLLHLIEASEAKIHSSLLGRCGKTCQSSCTPSEPAMRGGQWPYLIFKG